MARRTDLGTGSVQIQNEVIGSIAAMAAQEVRGVVGVWRTPWPWRILGNRSGVSVQAIDQEVRLRLNLVAEYGINLPQVAAEVQERVREMVERMTHLTAVEVQVSIQEVKPRRSDQP